MKTLRILSCVLLFASVSAFALDNKNSAATVTELSGKVMDPKK